MESIEQLRRDPRPLISLGTASAATGESLGTLLSNLADKRAPLFLESPPEARIYCITPSNSGLGKYEESILGLSKRRSPNAGLELHSIGAPYVEASHFIYLVLMGNDYSHLLNGDISLSIKLFNQAAALDENGTNLVLVSASQYFREYFPNSSFPLRVNAKFACYFENEEWPGAFGLRSLQARPEKLQASRKALLTPSEKESTLNDSLPPELTKHLQPWKSEFLRAMNTAAYEVYSNFKETEIKDSKVKPQVIKEAILRLLPRAESDAKIASAASLLRHDHEQLKAKEYLKLKAKEPYPYYFSPKLIYLNEKSKSFCQEYSNVAQIPHTAASVELDLNCDKIIPANTARRIAGEIKPDYEKITRSEK